MCKKTMLCARKPCCVQKKYVVWKKIMLCARNMLCGKKLCCVEKSHVVCKSTMLCARASCCVQKKSYCVQVMLGVENLMCAKEICCVQFQLLLSSIVSFWQLMYMHWTYTQDILQAINITKFNQSRFLKPQVIYNHIQ